ncbi:hypothetical protein OXX80_006030 [Metschnikowia pulcherrima]
MMGDMMRGMMMDRAPKRMCFSKEQAMSPDFTLPPLEFSTDVIKYGLFTWDLVPFVQGQPRKIHVSCTECSKEYNMKWPLNTTTLKSHYQTRHQETLVRILGNGAAERKRARTENKRQNDGGDDEFDENVFLKLLTQMSLATNMPPGVIDGRSFRDLISLVRGELPPSMKSANVEAEFKRMYAEELVKTKLKLAKHKGTFAMTFALWETKKRKDEYLSEYTSIALKLHWLDEDMGPEELLVGFEAFQDFEDLEAFVLGQSHKQIDDSCLKKCVMKALKEYDIAEDRVISITRGTSLLLDWSADSYKEEYSSKHAQAEFEGDIRCIESCITFWVKRFFQSTFFRYGDVSVDKIEGVTPENREFYYNLQFLPDLIRSLFKYIRENGELYKTFREGVEARESSKNNPKFKFELPQPDRKSSWLTTDEMVKTALEYRTEINAALKEAQKIPLSDLEEMEFEPRDITDEEWEYLAAWRETLDIFKKCLGAVKRASFPSISFTIPAVCRLLANRDKLVARDSVKSNHLLVSSLEKIEKNILKFYPIHDEDIGPIKNLYLATVLDPRSKLQIFTDLGFSESVISNIRKYVDEVYARYKSNYEASLDPSSSSEQDDIFVRYDRAHNALDAYLSEARKPRTSSVAGFYRLGRSSDPVMYKMARDFLAMKPTSAPANRLFHDMADVLRAQTVRISRSAMRNMVILKVRGVVDKNKNSNSSDEEDDSDSGSG